MGLGRGGLVATTRSIMVCMNTVFLLCGLALCAMGALVLTKTTSIVFADRHLAFVCIGLGVFVSLVACCGCFGSVTKSKFMLQFYFIFLFLVFAGQVAIVVIAFTQHAKLESLIQSTWSSSGPAVQNKFQNEHHCCGFNAPTLPCQPCQGNITGCPVPGCRDALNHVLNKNLLAIEIGACIIGALELFGLIGACCVIYSRKREDSDDLFGSVGEPLLGDSSTRSRNRDDTVSAFPVRNTPYAARPRNPSYNRLSTASTASSGTAANSIYLAGGQPEGDVAASVSSSGTWRPRTTAEMIAEIRKDRIAKERGEETGASPGSQLSAKSYGSKQPTIQ